MDSSQIFGDDDEECQSSESGWTMYLGSPANGDQIDDDDQQSDDGSDGDDHSKKPNHHYHHDGDSDDSMASDASSGPKNLNPRLGNGESSRTTGQSRLAVQKHKEEDEEEEKGKKPAKKKRGERRKTK
ncbi:hypothetical protein UlMin_008629 [Ulmus minor]